MNIIYNYKVTRVDQQARVMEVEYSSEGRQTMLIGMPLPTGSQTVVDLVKQYAPTTFWHLQTLATVEVEENTVGVIDTTVQATQPTQEQILKNMIDIVQAYIDAPANAWGYDDAKSAVTYLGDPNPQFAAEAMAIRDFRSACWVRAWQLRDEVEAGTRQTPTKEELYAELPAAPARPQA